MKKNKSPKRSSMISWIIMCIGAVLCLIGALVAHNYELNLLIGIGGIVLLVGIMWHVIKVRCPYCGRSLVGYRPLPTSCPQCYKSFEK